MSSSFALHAGPHSYKGASVRMAQDVKEVEVEEVETGVKVDVVVEVEDFAARSPCLAVSAASSASISLERPGEVVVAVEEEQRENTWIVKRKT